jgi:hypothetical protein
MMLLKIDEKFIITIDNSIIDKFFILAKKSIFPERACTKMSKIAKFGCGML